VSHAWTQPDHHMASGKPTSHPGRRPYVLRSLGRRGTRRAHREALHSFQTHESQNQHGHMVQPLPRRDTVHAVGDVARVAMRHQEDAPGGGTGQYHAWSWTPSGVTNSTSSQWTPTGCQLPLA